MEQGRAPILIGDKHFSVPLFRCPWADDSWRDASRCIDIYTNAINPQFPKFPFPGGYVDQPAYVTRIIDICQEESIKADTARIESRAREASKPSPGQSGPDQTRLPPKRKPRFKGNR